MCKKASEIALVLALLGALTACGSTPDDSQPPEPAGGSPVIVADEPGLLSSKADVPLPEEPLQPVSAASQGEEPEIKDSPGPGRTPALAAYRAILEDIYYDHKFPDGAFTHLSKAPSAGSYPAPMPRANIPCPRLNS